MMRFLGIEHFKSGHAAIVAELFGGSFNMDERSLKQRIEIIKIQNGDIAGEMKALKALEEARREK